MKKYRESRFIGCQWEIIVLDGNADEWLTIFPDCPTGMLALQSVSATAEIQQDIVRALREAADWLEANRQRGPAQIISLFGDRHES